MYTRPLTWQDDPDTSPPIQSAFENSFSINAEATDIRFNLLGYGWKKVGEQNRIIYHFGCYQCFIRKVGEVNFQLFAHAQSEREATELADVYKDISVTTGLLDRGRYEVKIVACRGTEFSAWTGGVIEGITPTSRLFYNLAIRTIRPLHFEVGDLLLLADEASQGVTPIPLFVVDEAIIDLTDVVTSIFFGYLIGQAPNEIIEAISITEFRNVLIILGPVIIENITVTEFFQTFSTLIQNHSPVEIISVEEFANAKRDINESFNIEQFFVTEVLTMQLTFLNLPPFGVFLGDLLTIDDIARLRYEGDVFAQDPVQNLEETLPGYSVLDALPDIGMPITNESPSRLGLQVFQPLFATERFNDLALWTVTVTGSGAINISGGRVALFLGNSPGTARLERTASFSQLDDVQNTRYLMIQFDLEHTVYSGANVILNLILGNFGSLNFNRIGSTFTIDADNAGLPAPDLTITGFDFGIPHTFRIEASKFNRYVGNSPEDRKIMYDIWIDGVYQGRIFGEPFSVVAADRTKLRFQPTSFNNEYRLDNLHFGLLSYGQRGNERSILVNSKQADRNRDVLVQDVVVSMSIVLGPQREIIKFENITVMESVTLVSAFVTSSVFDQPSVAEFVDVNVFGSRLVFESIGVTEDVVVLSLGNRDAFVFDGINLLVDTAFGELRRFFIVDAFASLSAWTLGQTNATATIDPAGEARLRITSTGGSSVARITRTYTGAGNEYDLHLKARIKIENHGTISSGNVFRIQIGAPNNIFYSIQFGLDKYVIGNREFNSDLPTLGVYHDFELIINSGGLNGAFSMASLYKDGLFVGAGSGGILDSPRLRLEVLGPSALTEARIDSVELYHLGPLGNIHPIFRAEGTASDTATIAITESVTMAAV